MADKEQIIIYGIDVSKCKFYRPGSFPTDCEINPVNAYCESPTSSNCYFKQQARKTQECEELKKDLQDYESWFDEYKILFTYDGRTPVTNDELYTCLEELVKKGNDETNRYRKALEEIEKATKINCEEICGRKFEDCNDTSCFSVELLDIINKAKGEGNATKIF